MDREQLVEDFVLAYRQEDTDAMRGVLDDLFPDPGFPSDGPRVARWLAAYVLQTKGRFAGRPLVVEAWQYDFLVELYRLDGEGRRVYTEALLLIPRKNGKSTIASGLALFHLCADYESSPEVYVAAGARDQAAVIFAQAKATVESSPRLGFLKCYQRHVSNPSNLGVFRTLSSDAKLQHGTNPSANFIDEKWGHKTNDLTTALTSGTGAREEPLTLTISTAGDDYDASPLGLDLQAARLLPDRELREDGFLEVARDVENGYLLWAYGPPLGEDGGALVDLDDPETWRRCNPASWVGDDYLRRQRHKPSVRLTDFHRFHLNVWTAGADYWLPLGAWQACAAGFEKIEPNARVFAGVDIGQKRDRAAVAVIRPRDVEVQDEHGETVVEHHFDVEVKVWTPPGDGRALDLGPIRAHLRRLADELDVIEVAYDPWRFEESAQDLADEGLPMVELPQSNERMNPASAGIFEVIVSARLHHSGDPVLAAHVGAGATTENERGWRLTKRKATKPIDALIAATLALARAQAHEDDGGSVYDGRGLIVL